MDLYKAIRDLRAERDRLDKAIQALEEMLASQAEPGREPGKTRGRRGMSAEERKAVSERMRQYWAARRRGPGAPPS